MRRRVDIGSVITCWNLDDKEDVDRMCNLTNQSNHYWISSATDRLLYTTVNQAVPYSYSDVVTCKVTSGALILCSKAFLLSPVETIRNVRKLILGKVSLFSLTSLIKSWFSEVG